MINETTSDAKDTEIYWTLDSKPTFVIKDVLFLV